MLAHRLRRWSNIEESSGEYPVFAGNTGGSKWTISVISDRIAADTCRPACITIL